MTKTISIIDDHNTLLNTLSLQFQIHNYKTLTFECPLKALAYHSKYPADGYIIDMKMPKLTGIEFYKKLCNNLKKDKLPALFLTGVHELEKEALKSTSIGDFVKKPFNFEILIVRLEKILEYFTISVKEKIIKVGNLEVLPDMLSIKWYGNSIEMTKREFALLNQLIKRPRIINSRDLLLDVCYGEDVVTVDRNIDSHIKRIRRKFKKAYPNQKFDRIKTHYGSGYSWQPRGII